MPRFPFAAAVELPHPPEVAFDYLVEPRNRPEWQASLLSVKLEDRDAEPHEGMTWNETTAVGLKPDMEITELRPSRLFTERGTWRGVVGVLSMRFASTPHGCRIELTGHTEGRGAWAIPARVGARLAGRAVASDLKRAGRVLTDRGPRV